MGKRQHHCRKCGKALCQKCASNQIVMPKLGFEFSPVRVCKSCSESVSDADKTPLAKMTSFNRQVKFKLQFSGSMCILSVSISKSTTPWAAWRQSTATNLSRCSTLNSEQSPIVTVAVFQLSEYELLNTIYTNDYARPGLWYYLWNLTFTSFLFNNVLWKNNDLCNKI